MSKHELRQIARKPPTWPLLAMSSGITLFLLSGCGSGVAPTRQDLGAVAFNIQWPSNSRLIPENSTCIKIELVSGNATVRTKVVPKGQPTATLTEVPAGDITAVATAYPQYDGTNATGVPQASGRLDFRVEPNTTVTKSLSMLTTIATVDVSPNPLPLANGGTASLAASPRDASGATVMTAPGNWTWTSDNPAVAIVTPKGSSASIQAVANGHATITATETESKKSGQAIVTVSAANQINFPSFPAATSLNLNGDATVIDSRLRVSPATSWDSGSAWYREKQTIANGFDTTFKFQINQLTNPTADGLAFVIQNSGTNALGSYAEGVGYGDAYSAGIPDSLAIEFDTYENWSEDDPNGNHISINTRGTAENSADATYSLGYTTSIPKLADGTTHTVKISYVPGTLTVYLDNMTAPVLTVPYRFDTGGKYRNGNNAPGLNLDGGKAWVGFTASTGTYYGNHDILSWSFAPH